MSSASSANPAEPDLEKFTPAASLKQNEPESQPQLPSDEPVIDPNIVTWTSPEDPENPQNWSTTRKLYLTIIFALPTLVVSLVSSIFSSADAVLAEKFGVSSEVTILGTSLFVLVCLPWPFWKDSVWKAYRKS